MMQKSSIFPKSGTLLRANSKTMEKITSEITALKEAVANPTTKNAHAEKRLEELNAELNRFVSVVVEDKKNATTVYCFQLSIFRNLKKLHLQMCPPTIVVDFYLLRNSLEVLEITNSGISKLYKAFVGSSQSLGRTDSMEGSPRADTRSGNYSPMSYSGQSRNVAPFQSLSPSPGLEGESGRGLLKQLEPMIMSKEIFYEIPEHLQWRHLRQVRIANCGVARMDQSFHFMPFIEYLDLSFNEITHIVHLQDCVRLSTLDLSYNRIRVLSNIGRVLGNITDLDISHNKVQSLDGIEKVFALQRLNAANNELNDFVEVSYLSTLPNLEHVCLLGNSIASNPNYRLLALQHLLQDGGLIGSSRSLPILDGQSLSSNEEAFLKSFTFRALEDEQRDRPHLPQLSRRALDMEEELEDEDGDHVGNGKFETNETRTDAGSLQQIGGNYEHIEGSRREDMPDIEDDKVFDEDAALLSRTTTPTTGGYTAVPKYSDHAQATVKFGSNRVSVDAMWPDAEYYRRLSIGAGPEQLSQYQSGRMSTVSTSASSRFSFGASSSHSLGSGDVPLFLLLFRGYWKKKFKKAKQLHRERLNRLATVGDGAGAGSASGLAVLAANLDVGSQVVSEKDGEGSGTAFMNNGTSSAVSEGSADYVPHNTLPPELAAIAHKRRQQRLHLKEQKRLKEEAELIAALEEQRKRAEEEARLAQEELERQEEMNRRSVSVVGGFTLEGTNYELNQLKMATEGAVDGSHSFDDFEGVDAGGGYHYYDEAKGEIMYGINRSQSLEDDAPESPNNRAQSASVAGAGRSPTRKSSGLGSNSTSNSPVKETKTFLGKSSRVMKRGLKSFWGNSSGSKASSAQDAVTSGNGAVFAPTSGRGGYSMAAACAAAASASKTPKANGQGWLAAGSGSLDDEGNFESRPSVIFPAMNAGSSTSTRQDGMDDNVDYIDPELEESKHAYVGDPEHRDLLVMEHLELYFSSQVFSWGKRVGKPHAYMAMGPFLLEKGENSEFCVSVSQMQTESGTDSSSAGGKLQFEYDAPSARGLASYSRFVSKPPRPEAFIGLYEANIVDVPALDDADNNSRAMISGTNKKQATSLAARFRRKASTNLGAVSAQGSADMLARSDAAVDGESAISQGQEPSAQTSNEQPISELSMLLVLTDICFYFVFASSIPPTATFKDVPIPLVFRVHPLHHMRNASVYFGYQRCALQFSPPKAPAFSSPVSDTVTSPGSPVVTLNKSLARDEFRTSSLFTLYSNTLPGCKPAYAYQVITREKSKLYPVMSNIIQMASAAISLEAKEVLASTVKSSDAAANATEIFENQGDDDYDTARKGIRSRGAGAGAGSAAGTGATGTGAGAGAGVQEEVRLINRDMELVEALAAAVASEGSINVRGGDLDIVYYQMLFQCWRLRPGVFIARTVIVTDSLILLCYEDLRQLPVQLKILDTVKPKEVQSIRCEDVADPLFVTLVIKPSKVLRAIRKWRLKVDNVVILNKFMEEIKRVCAKFGRTDI